MRDLESDAALAVIKQLIEDANKPQVNSSKAVLTELSQLKQDIATAKGAFWATGSVGSVLIVVLTFISLYAWNKLDNHDVKIAGHETRISVVESRLNLLTNVRYKK